MWNCWGSQWHVFKELLWRCRSKEEEKREDQGDMRAQAGLTAPDSQPRPILPQKPASDYQIHYIIPVLLLQNLPLNIQLKKVTEKGDFASGNRIFLNLSAELFRILPPKFSGDLFWICQEYFSELFYLQLSCSPFCFLLGIPLSSSFLCSYNYLCWVFPVTLVLSLSIWFGPSPSLGLGLGSGPPLSPSHWRREKKGRNRVFRFQLFSDLHYDIYNTRILGGLNF